MNGRETMKHWTEISNQMAGFMEERFNEVILRDMMTHDEEGMFFLFCFEQGMVGFQKALVQHLQNELLWLLQQSFN
tara:strand:+ start:125 stop:352 length:228 start_codon:yes stop_codon:yes gene_type:complete